MARKPARTTPVEPPGPDPRQMTIEPADPAPPRKPPTKALPATQVTDMAKRAVDRRGVADGCVRIAVSITPGAAETLSASATREAWNLEGLAAKLLEREAGR